MAFWAHWQLWEKLCLIMGLLIVTVFCYALGRLSWNRWKTSKSAAAEAMKDEEEAELYPMLHKDDLAFGARALESGIEIEGIWNSKTNTPVPSPRTSATTVGSQAARISPYLLPRTMENSTSSLGSQSSLISPKPMPPAAQRGVVSELDLASAGSVYELPRPDGLYCNRASLPASPNSPSMSPAREETVIGIKDPIVREKRASLHSQIFTPSHQPEAKDYRSGLEIQDEDSGYVAAMSGSSPRSESGHKRVSRFTNHLRRRSSEEFRRKMSRIFNDNVQMGVPAEQLEFNPALREYYKRNFRKSLLRPFWPRRGSSLDESQ